jgi:trehalose 6-phosphate phosphatase
MTNAGGELAEQAVRLATRADQVALCLDFDGTLSPTVADPEAARPLPGVAELLGPLGVWFAAVALISGRPAAYLTEHAAAPSMRSLGLYGLQEIRDGQVERPGPDSGPTVVAERRSAAGSPGCPRQRRLAGGQGGRGAVHTRHIVDPTSGPVPLTTPPRRVGVVGFEPTTSAV